MNHKIIKEQDKKHTKSSLMDLLQTVQRSVNKILQQSEESMYDLFQQLQNITLDSQNYSQNHIRSPASHHNQLNEQLQLQQACQQNSNSLFISQVQSQQAQLNGLSISKQQMKKQNHLFNQKANQSELTNLNTKQIGKIKIGELQKKKKQLMQKLKAIDQQLYKVNHKDQTTTSTIFKNNSPLNASRSPVNSKAKKQNTALQHSRTLQILQQFNNEKIKRHQQMIDKMQIRQTEEMKKIEQLQSRKIQIQLKRSRYIQSKLQNDQTHTKRPRPKQQKLRV